MMNSRGTTFQARRSLGASFTSAKVALWRILRHGALDRRVFWRRHSVGPYVLDLCCPTENLVIEVVGGAGGGRAHDPARAGFLGAIGLQILRIENREVFRNPDGVLARIRRSFRASR